jgi:hypothetical protein
VRGYPLLAGVDRPRVTQHQDELEFAFAFSLPLKGSVLASLLGLLCEKRGAKLDGGGHYAGMTEHLHDD